MFKIEIVENIMFTPDKTRGEMAIPIPPARKPVQLYVWSQCGYCVKQKNVLDSMSNDMRAWFSQSVDVTVVADPTEHPMVKGYPFWVVRGIAEPGFKNLQQVMDVRRRSS
jgi:hypothetical protein